jgi:hypothetical protein
VTTEKSPTVIIQISPTPGSYSFDPGAGSGLPVEGETEGARRATGVSPSAGVNFLYYPFD